MVQPVHLCQWRGVLVQQGFSDSRMEHCISISSERDLKATHQASKRLGQLWETGLAGGSSPTPQLTRKGRGSKGGWHWLTIDQTTSTTSLRNVTVLSTTLNHIAMFPWMFWLMYLTGWETFATEERCLPLNRKPLPLQGSGPCEQGQHGQGWNSPQRGPAETWSLHQRKRQIDQVPEMDCLQDANKQHATKVRSWGIEELSESGLLNLCCPLSYKPFEFVGGTWLQLFCSRVAILDPGRWKGIGDDFLCLCPLDSPESCGEQHSECRDADCSVPWWAKGVVSNGFVLDAIPMLYSKSWSIMWLRKFRCSFTSATWA